VLDTIEVILLLLLDVLENIVEGSLQLSGGVREELVLDLETRRKGDKAQKGDHSERFHVVAKLS
jgi:hypothetical protein